MSERHFFIKYLLTGAKPKGLKPKGKKESGGYMFRYTGPDRELMYNKLKKIMETKISDRQLFHLIRLQIILELNNCKYDGDLTDIGDLVGRAVGRIIIANKTPDGFEKDDFMIGFNHGFSIEDGTHG